MTRDEIIETMAGAIFKNMFAPHEHSLFDTTELGSHYREAAADTLTALEAAGYVVVPREPTKEMLRGVPDWDRAVWETMLASSQKG